MEKNYEVVVRGNEGVFTVSKRIVLFHNHVTEENVQEVFSAIKKEVKSLLKTSQVTIDFLESGSSYNSKDRKRLILSNYDFNLQVRPFNGIDYSNVKEYTFTSQNDMLKYSLNVLKDDFNEVMGEIPLETSRFTEELRNR
jgi:hypothetical protein